MSKQEKVGTMQMHLTGIAEGDQEGMASIARLLEGKFPPRYRVHQYWARKPWYMVREYISRYTSPGDTVLDPFVGSGVTACETLILRRKIIWRDLNPIAGLITKVTCVSPVDLSSLHTRAVAVLNELQRRAGHLYISICPHCGTESELINAVWNGETLERLYIHCQVCMEAFQKPADPHDIKLGVNHLVGDPPFKSIYEQPLPSQSDAKRLGELYTSRNWLALTTLFQLVESEPADDIGDAIRLMFCATTVRVSRLIFVNRYRFNKGANPAGVWGEKRFWLPKQSVENNLVYYFAERIRNLVKAKQQTNRLIGDFYRPGDTIMGKVGSALSLEIPSDSVDYCFTDPPYGGSVQYLGLSTIWNAWLSRTVDRKQEIVVDNERSLEDYQSLLYKAFREIHRVLKPGGYASVTFHSGDTRVWEALLFACSQAGFTFQKAVPWEPAKRSHNQLDMPNSVETDFVVTFRKETSSNGIIIEEVSDGLSDLAFKSAQTLLKDKGSASTPEIYDKVILAWLTKSSGRPSGGEFGFTMGKLDLLLEKLGFRPTSRVEYDYKNQPREVKMWMLPH